jgi:hypothetical protein
MSKDEFRKLGNLVRIYDEGEPITLILRYIALLLIIFHPLWHMWDYAGVVGEGERIKKINF